MLVHDELLCSSQHGLVTVLFLLQRKVAHLQDAMELAVLPKLGTSCFALFLCHGDFVVLSGQVIPARGCKSVL